MPLATISLTSRFKFTLLKGNVNYYMKSEVLHAFYELVASEPQIVGVGDSMDDY